jgi:hypothetical protein
MDILIPRCSKSVGRKREDPIIEPAFFLPLIIRL